VAGAGFAFAFARVAVSVAGLAGVDAEVNTGVDGVDEGVCMA
jgi:hypothetical protein